MPQLSFEWRPHISYAPEDFILSESNKEAVRFLESFPNSHARIALLSGPSSCGKTHLAHLWSKRNSGIYISNPSLGTLPSEQLWQGSQYAILEDIETAKDETALFHLLRDAEIQEKCLLMTAAISAKFLPFTLPDLRSRLIALPTSSVAQPDEQLLYIFAAKCFSDRQLRVSEAVIQYLVNHAERSFNAVHSTIDKAARTSLESKKEITIPLIKKVLGH